ncbi:hypothetical protein M501DRAFT_1015006 [Patellaria atrata CBS 101060]|uniref:Uncharacterized protein n=1 Tax=Patellaria atrata CBS 101060 TaxID=1346257 RepID=A0A9P4VUW3_9PEZI|nr:hypothetical protein M501DRAFT_1015006 [Patellaria atrata CBS 101060]
MKLLSYLIPLATCYTFVSAEFAILWEDENCGGSYASENHEFDTTRPLVGECWLAARSDNGLQYRSVQIGIPGESTQRYRIVNCQPSGGDTCGICDSQEGCATGVGCISFMHPNGEYPESIWLSEDEPQTGCFTGTIPGSGKKKSRFMA